MAVAHDNPQLPRNSHGAFACIVAPDIVTSAPVCVTNNGATLLAPPTPAYGLVPPIECDKHDGAISCYVPH